MPSKFHCPDPGMIGHVQKVFAGEYDIPELRISQPRILDIGANVGSFSIWAKKRWLDAKIECYEPHLNNYQILKRNIPNGHCYRVAVSGDDGRGFLRDGLHNCGEASLLDVGEQSDKGQMVDVMSAKRLPRADIIKLDTEGSEYPILNSYGYLNHAKAVMLEWHSIEDRYRIGELLLRAGMKLYSDEAWATNRGIMKFWRPECSR